LLRLFNCSKPRSRNFWI